MYETSEHGALATASSLAHLDKKEIRLFLRTLTDHFGVLPQWK